MLILCLWIPLKGDKSVVIMFSRFVYSLIEAGRLKWYYWVGQKYYLDFSLRCHIKKLNEAFSQPVFPHMTCIYDAVQVHGQHVVVDCLQHMGFPENFNHLRKKQKI